MTDETLSLSERAHAVIERRLAKVRKANGFRTDAGLRVKHSVRNLDPADLPAFDIFEESEDVGTTGTGNNDSMKVSLTIVVECHIKVDQDDTGRMLQRMKADAKKALLVNKGALDDECESPAFAVIIYNGATASPRENGSSSESVGLRFTITYPEGYGDPYAKR